MALDSDLDLSDDLLDALARDAVKKPKEESEESEGAEEEEIVAAEEAIKAFEAKDPKRLRSALATLILLLRD